jgi:transcriptional regulator with XRE-family HTH domain
MHSEELRSSFQKYEIGPKIRKLRRSKNLALKQLGMLTGLSGGMLSKIERGLQIPPILTLMKLATVLDVGLEHFFDLSTSGSKITIVRKCDRLRFPERPDKELPSYFFENLVFTVSGPKVTAYYAEFEDDLEPPEAHAHPGAEVIYVVKGQLIVTIRGEELTLEEGDSVYFDSSSPHSYRRLGRRTCSAIVVVAH